MAAKFASLTALLLLGTVANVAEPVFARAVEGRQVVSSVATVPAGTTAVPSSVSVSTVSICTYPVTATGSAALPSTTITSNLTANGTAVSEPSTTVASNVSASSFFFSEPVGSPTASVPIESPTESISMESPTESIPIESPTEIVPIESPTASVVATAATNATSSLWSSGGPAATYTPMLNSTHTGFPANFTTIGNTDTAPATVSSVFTPASPSGEPTASVVTVYYDCGANATASVSPTSTAVAASSPVNATSVEVTATAVPTVNTLFKRE